VKSKRTAIHVILSMCSLTAVLLFWLRLGANAADSRESIHQKVLAGDQIFFNPNDPEDARTVDAAWIKEAALKHVRINIYNAIIQSNLDMHDITFEQEFVLRQCIVDYADFSYTVFKRNLNLNQTAFRHGALFQSATFESAAYFDQTEFDGGLAGFQDAHALGVFEAEKAKFVSKMPSVAEFRHAQFDRTADFINASFGFDADFSATEFGGEALFEGTQFERDAVFERAHFHDVACFGCYYTVKRPVKTMFNHKVDFTAARFDFEATFTGAVFGATADFFRAQFGAAGNFSAATFKGEANFGGAQISTDALFIGTVFDGQAMFGSTHIFRHALFYAVNPVPAAVFRAEATFAWAEIDGVADFTGTLFAAEANFSGTKIGENANFCGTDFRADVHFLGTVIGGDAVFSGSLFKGKAVFNHLQIKGSVLFGPDDNRHLGPVRFDRDVDFAGSRFGANVQFDRAEFRNGLKLEHAEIEGRTIFLETRFLGSSTPSFRGTTFRQESWFQGTDFTKGVSFSGSQFYAEARFSGVKFEDAADFTGAHFAGLAFFSKGPDPEGANELSGSSFHEVSFDHARFDGDADFTESTFANKVSFRETSFRTVYFSPTGMISGSQQFLGDIDLRGCTYDRIQAHLQSLLRYPDSERSRVRPFDRQPYVELEEVLRKAGSDEQAKAVYLERRRVERDSMNWSAKIWDYFYWLAANYGTDLWGEFILTIFLIMLGSLIYLRSGAVVSEHREVGTHNKITWWNAIALATHHFLPFGLPEKSQWTPSRCNLWPPVPLKAATYANILRISGWILVPLGAATLTGVLRRGAP
jgi:hypothetical protein